MNSQTQSIVQPEPSPHGDTSGESWVRLRQRLLRHARMMVSEPALAEDLVQDSLIAVLEKPEAHRGEASIMTWAVAILKHKIADWYRSPHQRRRTWIEADDNEDVSDPTEGLYDEKGSYKEPVPAWQQPEMQETQRQMMSVMEACLKRLPSQTGRVFMMREWLGFETAEICELLSLSAENCRMILHRARMGLRQCMCTQGYSTGSFQ